MELTPRSTGKILRVNRDIQFFRNNGIDGKTAEISRFS